MHSFPTMFSIKCSLAAFLKASGRLSPMCADYVMPTLCNVLFSPCVVDGGPDIGNDQPGRPGVGGGLQASDSRRGRGPRRRPLNQASSSSPTAARRRRLLCSDECRVLDASSCRTEYKTVVTAAAAAASAGSSRRQLQSFSKCWARCLQKGFIKRKPISVSGKLLYRSEIVDVLRRDNRRLSACALIGF